MAGLITDLMKSAAALQAQQAGLQVTSNNLANVNNPSYARESIVLGANGVLETSYGEQSMGVQATGVQEARNPFIDAQVTQELSITGSLQAQETQLTEAQSSLGEQVTSSTSSSSISDTSQSTDGISSALNNFFNAWSNLAANPNDSGAKATLLSNAGTLVTTINNADSQLASLQSSINSQITQNAGTANGILTNIASLNSQIQQFEVQNPGSTPNDLIDQRQADLQQLAGYMNFTATNIPNSNGQIQVTTADSNSNPVTLVSKGEVEGNGLSFNGAQFTAGSPATILGLTSGSLVGNLTASTGAIQTLRNNLATTASQLTAAVNSAYNPTNATGNFFQTTPSSGLIQLDPTLSASTLKTTDTSNSGANELALAVSNVQSQTFSTSGGDQINGTIGGYYSSSVTSLGESIDSVQSELADQTNVQNMVEQQQSSVSGVNEDEEVTNLMTYQRAFQAQAQVINVMNDCLGAVVTGLFGTPVS